MAYENVCKYFNISACYIPGAYTSVGVLTNGCDNDSVSLFRGMLHWLANCSIKYSLF